LALLKPCEAEFHELDVLVSWLGAGFIASEYLTENGGAAKSLRSIFLYD